MTIDFQDGNLLPNLTQIRLQAGGLGYKFEAQGSAPSIETVASVQTAAVTGQFQPAANNLASLLLFASSFQDASDDRQPSARRSAQTIQTRQIASVPFQESNAPRAQASASGPAGGRNWTGD
jgi:hypothetical protein